MKTVSIDIDNIYNKNKRFQKAMRQFMIQFVSNPDLSTRNIFFKNFRENNYWKCASINDSFKDALNKEITKTTFVAKRIKLFLECSEFYNLDMDDDNDGKDNNNETIHGYFTQQLMTGKQKMYEIGVMHQLKYSGFNHKICWNR